MCSGRMQGSFSESQGNLGVGCDDVLPNGSRKAIVVMLNMLVVIRAFLRSSGMNRHK